MQLRTVEPQHMVVTQANELATAAYSMTLMEKRLVLLVASMMRKDDEYMKRYRFPAADVMNFLGLSSNKNGYQELRKLTADLLSRVVDMDLEGDGDYIQFQWMASARYISKGKSETGKAEIELKPIAKCAHTCSNSRSGFLASPLPRSPSSLASIPCEFSRFFGLKATSCAEKRSKSLLMS